ncbi:hypothetical protein LSAT2_031662 [Lamellibrachia satsuma]|nr:hypothetical protein LSAT2_031662 [Lamellibrachia satsuma]
MLFGLALLTYSFRRKRESEDGDDAKQHDNSLSAAKPTKTTTSDHTTSSVPVGLLGSMPHPQSSGDRSHDTTSHETSYVTASKDDLMTALSSGGILKMKHAELLVSLLSTDDFALLQRVLVTVANAAAFTSNQVR